MMIIGGLLASTVSLSALNPLVPVSFFKIMIGQESRILAAKALTHPRESNPDPDSKITISIAIAAVVHPLHRFTAPG